MTRAETVLLTSLLAAAVIAGSSLPAVKAIAGLAIERNAK